MQSFQSKHEELHEQIRWSKYKSVSDFWQAFSEALVLYLILVLYIADPWTPSTYSPSKQFQLFMWLLPQHISALTSCLLLWEWWHGMPIWKHLPMNQWVHTLAMPVHNLSTSRFHDLPKEENQTPRAWAPYAPVLRQGWQQGVMVTCGQQDLKS